MKIVVAVDSFKGSLRAEEAGRAVVDGLKEARPDVECVLKPMADGGEGTVDALLSSRAGGTRVTHRVEGPLPGRTVDAGFAWFPEDRMAVIEMAAASGLPLLKEDERNPLCTSTVGTGQLMAAAMEQGAERLLLGIGGSATVDGGVGAATVLGWRFLDEQENDVTPDGGHLGEIARILPPDAGRANWPRVTVLCDVTNPLCGPRGAAAVFGPQKGATPDMVKQLDEGLRNLAARIRTDVGKDVLDLPGGGAAGGLGAGAAAFFDAELAPGIETVMEAAGLREALAGADYCVTGEGSFDEQSLGGKVVSGVARLARERDVPVIVFAGRSNVDPETCREHGIRAAFGLQRPDLSTAESMARAAELLRAAAAQWLRELPAD